MQFEFNPRGIELVRPDGWRYRLVGIASFDAQGWLMRSWPLDSGFEVPYIEVGIINVRDETLESVRVLRDSFPDYEIRVVST